MKYVYVLVSFPGDFFYEQFVLSATSFRMHNPDAHITVLLDEKTKEGLTDSRCIDKIADEVLSVPVPPELSPKEASRWLKTSVRKHITGDFLFIDCDTIIAAPLQLSFPEQVHIAAALDKHSLLTAHHMKRDIQANDKRLGFRSSFNTDVHFNSGVIFCRDTPDCHAFFEKWHSLWYFSNQKGVSIDQAAFNQANYEMRGIISELDGSWNCQISHGGLPFLHRAKIIHYFANSLVTHASPYLLASKDILLAIRQNNGTIPAEIQQMLQNPLSAFAANTRIIADTNALAVFDSSIFYKLLFLKDKSPRFFERLDRFVSSLTVLVKKIIPYKKKVR
jgi:hypothetical protein